MSSGLCCNDLWCECAPPSTEDECNEPCCDADADLLSECDCDCVSESGSSESDSESGSDSDSSSSESGSDDLELDVEFWARVKALASRQSSDERPAKRHRGAILIDLTDDLTDD